MLLLKDLEKMSFVLRNIAAKNASVVPNIIESECPEEDSNLHGLAATSPSSWRVYQFHHLGSIFIDC